MLIKDEVVKRKGNYRYLGITIDDKLTCKAHVDKVGKKIHNRLCCLRKPRSIYVLHELLQLFYTFVICSTVTFDLAGGSIATQERDKRNKNILKKQEG